MTILEVLEAIDSLKPNAYSRNDKISWLSVLDGLLWQELFLTHEGSEGSFHGYDIHSPLDTELLAKEPYGRELYLRFLESRIDYHNGDTARFNNALSQFQSAYTAFARHYHRQHLPKGSKRKFW